MNDIDLKVCVKTRQITETGRAHGALIFIFIYPCIVITLQITTNNLQRCRKGDVGAWSGSSWLRIGTGGGGHL